MQKFNIIIILSFLSLIPANFGYSQDNRELSGYTDDSLYHIARDLAFEGNLVKAKEIADYLLARNHDHYDASVLAGRILAWDNKFEPARSYLYKVIEKMPAYYDALLALIDIDIWDGNLREADDNITNALYHHPGDEDLLTRRAKVFFIQGKEKEAEEILASILEINPDNQEAARMLRNINTPGVYYYRENDYILAGYYGEFFGAPYTRHLHAGTVGYSRFTGWGPLTGKINFANVFIDGTGMTRYPSLQYEIDFYPRLSPRSYLFLNYGFSGSIVFPEHRGAFEYFRSLSRGFEASAGFRFLKWDDNHLFFTGSAAKYYGDLWFSLRTYLFPADNGMSSSWFFNTRRYFDTADDFVGLIVGYGLFPDETLFDPEERGYLNSSSIGAEFSRGLTAKYLINGAVRYEYEEYRAGIYRSRFGIIFGLRYYL